MKNIKAVLTLSVLAGMLLSCQTALAASYSISLVQGWNLVSLPQTPADTAVGSVTASIGDSVTSIWTYDNGAWKMYDPANPGFSDLTTMTAGRGYWIKASHPATLTGGGTAPPKQVSLGAGWNLVGFNCSSQPVTDAFSTISGKYASVWGYVNGSWKVYNPNNPAFSDLATAAPGSGYWVDATQGADWSCEPPVPGAVSISTPTSEWATSTVASYTVGGSSTGTQTITWSNATGGSGQAAVNAETQTWSANVPLAQGDNKVSFSGGGGFSRDIYLVYNPTVDFQSLPTLSVNSMESGVATTITFTVAIAPANLNASTVELYETDAEGVMLAGKAPLGIMKDDGSFLSGSYDDVTGDNIYTIRLAINEATKNVVYFRVFTRDTTGNLRKSGVSKLFVVSKPPQIQIDNAKATAADISSYWDGIKSTLSLANFETKEKYLQAFSDKQQLLVDYLSDKPNNLFAFKGSTAVFYAMDNAPFVMVQQTIADPAAYETQIDSGADRSVSSGNPAQGRVPVFTADSLPGPNRRIMSAEDDAKNRINDKKAIFIDPYYWQHVATTKMTDANGPWPVIEAATCPKLTTSKELNGTDASPNVDPKRATTEILDAFTTLSNYGTIVIHTHGGHWVFSTAFGNQAWLTDVQNRINAIADPGVKAALSAWFTSLKTSVTSFVGKQVILASDTFVGQSLDAILTHKYWQDIVLGRLLVDTDGEIIVTPAFIDAHNGTFPNSVVWMGACHSLQDESMSSVFLNKGAGAYLGFSESVYRSWNVARGGNFFDNMLKKSKNAKDAFTATIAGGNDDGHGTSLVFKGNDNLSYYGGLVNGSFEDPKGAGSLSGWTVSGDGRAWKSFQTDVPTDGKTMAVISTGLGSSSSVGTLSQSACLPEKAKNIRFDWNFYSAEFIDYCASQYDDKFIVTINDVPVFETSVNAICGSDEGASYPLLAAEKIDETPDTWKTGWKSTVFDVSAHAGKDIQLKFLTTDVGDSAYDTAVLFDNITLETAP